MSLRVPVAAFVLSCVLSPVSAQPHRLGAPAQDAATLVGDGWLSGTANDYNLSMDAGRSRLVFGRSPTGDFEHAAIHVAQRDGDGWSAPAAAPFSDPRRRDSDPWLTPDGRWLYFVSNRDAPGRDAGRRDLDLWRVAITASGFGEPEHLALASSEGEELGPELHDGRLTFNSTRKGGPAQLALYAAPLVDGRPAAAEPLPAPFNDGVAQGDLTFAPDGQSALFWSIRGDSREPDLFIVHRTRDGWSAATRLPAPYNAPGMDFTPAWSSDGRSIYWASQRPHPSRGAQAAGAADIYVAPAPR